MFYGGAGAIFWLVVSILLFVAEGMTVQFICLWFAFGALFAMPAAFINLPVWAQLLIFLISSLAILAIGRPIITEKLRPRKEATNADRVIGQPGLVLQEIDNLKQTGRVSANGLDWTARSMTGEVIPEGAQVCVLHIDGVKLIVQQLSVTAEKAAISITDKEEEELPL